LGSTAKIRCAERKRDGRRLGRIRNATARRRRARRPVQDKHSAHVHALHADDAAPERRLAAPTRPEQTGDRTISYRSRYLVEGDASAADDAHTVDHDCTFAGHRSSFTARSEDDGRQSAVLP
jgi:hypothetical protein